MTTADEASTDRRRGYAVYYALYLRQVEQRDPDEIRELVNQRYPGFLRKPAASRNGPANRRNVTEEDAWKRRGEDV